MINNKRGLSDIILTLIMILLVLVAVGVVWAVASGVINKGAGKVDLGTRCLDVDIKAIALKTGTLIPSSYNLTLTRGAGGDNLAGVKIVLFSDSNNTGLINGAGLNLLETRTIIISSADSQGLTGANKVEITPYFLDDSGKEQICQTTGTFKF